LRREEMAEGMRWQKGGDGRRDEMEMEMSLLITCLVCFS
jgi:hypothetical protein